MTKTDGCWLWTAGDNGEGYGRFKPPGRRTVYAHRFSYELLRGPIPEGLQLDHLCRTPACVNPEHLEPVTNRENTLRGRGFAARNARKTHCPQGHPYDAGNTFVSPSGYRECRVCRKAFAAERSRRFWAKKKKKKATVG